MHLMMIRNHIYRRLVSTNCRMLIYFACPLELMVLKCLILFGSLCLLLHEFVSLPMCYMSLCLFGTEFMIFIPFFGVISAHIV